MKDIRVGLHFDVEDEMLEEEREMEIEIEEGAAKAGN